LAVVCALLAIGSFQTLFAALDRLEALHASLVVFPIAVGTAVAGFAVWARWGLGEPLGRRRAVGLALVTAGVVILGLR
jgi:multidrug transporter EmrE-like cation transporter